MFHCRGNPGNGKLNGKGCLLNCVAAVAAELYQIRNQISVSEVDPIPNCDACSDL